MSNSEKIYKTQGIILRHYPLGETDYILSLFTPNRGKVRAIVKGARKLKSRIGGHVEPVMLTSFLLTKGHNLDLINQAECIDSFRIIREDLTKLSKALYILDLVDAITNESQSNNDIYLLLLDTLKDLANDKNDNLIPYFQIKLLGSSGFMPELYQCVDCGKEIVMNAHRFCPDRGGVICDSCNPFNVRISTLSLTSLKVLRFFQRSDYNQVSALNIDGDTNKELQDLLYALLFSTIGKELKSYRFINDVAVETVNSLNGV